jgi:aldose 1-epimerase
VIEPFGELADGRIVHAITLGSPDSLQAQVLTYGGILRELLFYSRGTRHSLVVSLPALDSYVRDAAFVGIVVGRVANRIDRARFVLKGREHRLAANDGVHQLHGGRLGFGKRLWRIVDHDGANRLQLALHSPAGEEGYPGNLEATAEYVIDGPELRVRFECLADEDTPFAPTFHLYFNVRPESRLLIHGDAYLPVRDTEMIPTGEVIQVGGSPFDFRTPRFITPDSVREQHPQLRLAGGYDHCWVLNPRRECDAKLRISNAIMLTIRSDCPGLQFYGGQHSAALGGVCLEPQGLPNAVNVPSFPSIIVKSGTLWSTTFRYQLSD